jgi:hypothetical protein
MSTHSDEGTLALLGTATAKYTSLHGFAFESIALRAEVGSNYTLMFQLISGLSGGDQARILGEHH